MPGDTGFATGRPTCPFTLTTLEGRVMENLLLLALSLWAGNRMGRALVVVLEEKLGVRE